MNGNHENTQTKQTTQTSTPGLTTPSGVQRSSKNSFVHFNRMPISIEEMSVINVIFIFYLIFRAVEHLIPLLHLQNH